MDTSYLPQGTQPSGGEPGKLVSTDKPVAEPEHHNPSLLVQLLNCAYEATGVVEGVGTMALVDTGSKVSTLTEGSCLECGLRILPLGGLFHLKATGGIVIPYKGYLGTNLIIISLYQVCPSIVRTGHFWLFWITNTGRGLYK